jgi:hypothetical protein
MPISSKTYRATCVVLLCKQEYDESWKRCRCVVSIVFLQRRRQSRNRGARKDENHAFCDDRYDNAASGRPTGKRKGHNLVNRSPERRKRIGSIFPNILNQHDLFIMIAIEIPHYEVDLQTTIAGQMDPPNQLSSFLLRPGPTVYGCSTPSSSMRSTTSSIERVDDHEYEDCSATVEKRNVSATALANGTCCLTNRMQYSGRTVPHYAFLRPERPLDGPFRPHWIKKIPIDVTVAAPATQEHPDIARSRVNH